jgi:hypothetical protein
MSRLIKSQRKQELTDKKTLRSPTTLTFKDELKARKRLFGGNGNDICEVFMFFL